MTSANTAHVDTAPQTIEDLLKIFSEAPEYDLNFIPDVLASRTVATKYFAIIGSVQSAINLPTVQDNERDSLARGAILFFVLNHLVLTSIAEPNFEELNAIALDDDFLKFLIAFHKLPVAWNLKILGFHALGTTSMILKVHTIDHDICALKVLQAPYVRMLSITTATKAYERLSRSLNPRYSPQTFSSDKTWILMQFIHGVNLAEFLRKLRKDPSTRFMTQQYVSTIIMLFDFIVDALSYYEEKTPSVVHGDLNPYNIIVEGSIAQPVGIKLIDFGPNFVLQERVSNPRVFADVFSRTELFTAREILWGDQPTIKSDVYSLGMIGLEMLARDELRREKLGPLLEGVWREPLSMGLAQIIEDVIDDVPENRLLVTPIDRDFGVYRSINRFLQEQVYLFRYLASPQAKNLTLLGFVTRRFKPDVARAIENLQQIQQTSTLWDERITRIQIRLAQANAVFFYLIISLFCLYTFADLKAAFFPRLNLIVDKKWVELVGALPHWFTVGDVFGNLPGRGVALTFGLIAGHYYANIFSALRMTTFDKPNQALLTVFTRINAVSYVIPICVAIVLNPRLWPWCAFLGTLFPAINNLLCYRAADRITDTAHGVFSSTHALNPRDFVVRYKEWGVQMLMYSILILAMGVLLSSGFAQDEWVYASIVCGINFFKIDRSSCKSLAPETLGNLSRLSFTARRLLARR